MDPEETLEAGADRLPQPPPGSGIVVVEEENGIRITLPRLYSQGDVIVTVLAAAIAIWMAVWLDAMATGSTLSPLGRAIMVTIALGFGLLALWQAVPIILPRVIQERSDRIVLSRRLGVRLLLPRDLPKSEIRSVERTWQAGDAETAPGVVRIRTQRHSYPIGKELDPSAIAWLEGAVRTMAEQ